MTPPQCMQLKKPMPSSSTFSTSSQILKSSQDEDPFMSDDQDTQEQGEPQGYVQDERKLFQSMDEVMPDAVSDQQIFKLTRNMMLERRLP